MSTLKQPTRRRAQRSIAWLIGVLTLAGGPALLAPAVAPARTLGLRAIERRGKCTLEANVAPSQLTAGESATLVGSLECPLAADAGEQTITIYQHLAGTQGFAAVGTTITEADGSFRFTTAALEANSSFYAGAQGAHHSRRETVKVSPLVTISGPPANTQLLIASHRTGVSARASSTATFAGTVSPEDTGALVVLQRESATADEDWREIGFGRVSAEGGYSISHTFSSPGEATVRVVVRAHGLRASASEPLSYEIAPRQNPLLSITASSDPLLCGQPVTLSGTAAGAPGQTLTLLARSRDASFAPIATVTSDESGHYEFPAQTPLQSTYYKVSAAHTASTSLFEGVEPLLTADVSPALATSSALDSSSSPPAAAVSTAQAGQSLIFSGAITPDHTGQTIYLERQNPSGVGFHVVASATVGTGSTYSIEHTVSGSGTQAFRIKVPRDQESQATASELFKIQVTPASEAPASEEAPESE